MSQARKETKDLRHFTDLLQHHKRSLAERHKVKSLGIFGSFVRSDQQEGSDLDVLVEFAEVPSLFQFLKLENDLSDLLAIKVDLVMKDALKPSIGQHILAEVVSV